MREILFRGKTDKGEWVQGCLIQKESSVGNKMLSLIVGSAEWDNDSEFFHLCNTHRVTHETIGQYTGLTDKNGKKIFEGDIVHLTDVRYNNEWKAVVVFGNPYAQYSWGWNFQYIGKKPQINTDILLWVEMEDVQVYCEIIGNIHDNPELLESEVQGE